MNILVLDDATNFFSDLWQSISTFWFKPTDGSTPYIYNFAFALIWLVLAYFLIKLILFLIRKALKLNKNKKGIVTAKSFILDAIKVVLYIFAFVIFFYILKIDMSGMSTIFSSAILAVGLSLQSLIGNFASGLIILGSKHFDVGDYVSIKDSAEGTVTSVRFLSTELCTIDGQKVVVSNSTVVNSVIINYSSNPTRRLSIGITFSYLEEPDKVREALLSIIKTEKQVLKYPEPKVIVGSLDQNGVTYYVRCQTNTNDYWDILYRVNEKLIHKLHEYELKVQPSKVELMSCDLVKKDGKDE